MEFEVEKLVYGGDGLARLHSDAQAGPGKAVFIPYTLPRERVEAAIIEQKTGFARARLEQVLAPSPLRISAPCHYFGACGGCHYQHTSYEEQLRLKSDILREQLLRTAKLALDIPIQSYASPPLHYRNRTRFHLRHQPEFAIGYFRHGSRELLPVQECPISSPLINRALQQLWELGKFGSVANGIGEIELFANGNEEQLMVDLYLGKDKISREILKDFAARLARAMPQIHGIVSFLPASPGRSSLPTMDLLHGSPAIDYHAGRASYRVTAGAFFQTNRHLIDQMTEIVVGDRRGRLALDLYSGVGLFALLLGKQFDRVVAVESSPSSSADLRHNAPVNVKVSSQSVGDYLESATGQLHPDLTVLDPPRSGLGTAVCRRLSGLTSSEIVYVSCDPATLARDLKQLADGGWRVSAMHLVDLFPQTFHIETITVLQR